MRTPSRDRNGTMSAISTLQEQVPRTAAGRSSRRLMIAAARGRESSTNEAGIFGAVNPMNRGARSDKTIATSESKELLQGQSVAPHASSGLFGLSNRAKLSVTRGPSQNRSQKSKQGRPLQVPEQTDSDSDSSSDSIGGHASGNRFDGNVSGTPNVSPPLPGGDEAPETSSAPSIMSQILSVFPSGISSSSDASDQLTVSAAAGLVADPGSGVPAKENPLSSHSNSPAGFKSSRSLVGRNQRAPARLAANLSKDEEHMNVMSG